MTEDISGSEQIAYVFQSKIKDGQQSAFETLCTEAIEATRADPKAINYEFFIAGDIFHAFEKFSDSAATLAHLGWFGENIAPSPADHGRHNRGHGLRLAQRRAARGPGHHGCHLSGSLRCFAR